jgi:hypothetical protein
LTLPNRRPRAKIRSFVDFLVVALATWRILTLLSSPEINYAVHRVIDSRSREGNDAHTWR